MARAYICKAVFERLCDPQGALNLITGAEMLHLHAAPARRKKKHKKYIMLQNIQHMSCLCHEDVYLCFPKFHLFNIFPVPEHLPKPKVNVE